jgi:hypothetical protein
LPFIQSENALVARDKAGNQFAHHNTFDGCHVYSGEDGQSFMDIRSDAHAAAVALLKQIIAANPSELDSSDWQKISPVYGSSVHEENDLIAFERKREDCGMRF